MAREAKWSEQRVLGARWLQAGVLASLAFGCGASYPAPAQGLANAEAALRQARDAGAAGLTDANDAAYLAEAETGMGQARQALDQGDNRRAEERLLSVRAAAELALQLTREQAARSECERAEARLDAALQQRPNASVASVVRCPARTEAP